MNFRAAGTGEVYRPDSKVVPESSSFPQQKKRSRFSSSSSSSSSATTNTIPASRSSSSSSASSSSSIAASLDIAALQAKRKAAAAIAMKKQESYFDTSDDEDEEKTKPTTATASTAGEDEDEVDPLDAFMSEVSSTIQKEKTEETTYKPLEIVSETDRDYEAYEQLKAKEALSEQIDGDIELDYDSDGIPINKQDKKKIDPLPPIDHSQIQYPQIRKNFYSIASHIHNQTTQEVAQQLQEAQLLVDGNNTPRPIISFKDCGFNDLLLKEIVKAGFESPTAIQKQALPVALSGRDLIGLAKTGSGKTLAFVWPMIIHVLDQPQMKHGEGPIGLILSPTRELTGQIYTEAKKFAKIFNIRLCAVIGGEGKYEMQKKLKEEVPEIVVATPGRFIDLALTKATNLNTRCTMVVLDEADRMFEMGFEYQMRSILQNIRPNRQTLMFSATMKKKIEYFAREILQDPIRIVVGNIGQANTDIHQEIEVLKDESLKWGWLIQKISSCLEEGKVIIFVNAKTATEELSANLQRFLTSNTSSSSSVQTRITKVECLHGDKDQSDRSMIMRRFKSGETGVLVATDVAARGLDVKNIQNVINFEASKSIETHVHRIGRTGRMGVEGVNHGTAYTLLTGKDSAFAIDLLKNLKLSGKHISSELQRLAESDRDWHRRKVELTGNRPPFPQHQGGGKSRMGLGHGQKAMHSGMFVSESHRNTKRESVTEIPPPPPPNVLPLSKKQRWDT